MFFDTNGRSHPTRVLYPISWIFTTTGAIVVLYSRLHLIIDAPRTLKWLAYILVGVGIPFQVFIVVASRGDKHNRFLLGRGVHNVQVRLEVLTSGVEIILAAVYIYVFTKTFIKDGNVGFRDTKMRKQLRSTFGLLIFGAAFVVVSLAICTTEPFSIYDECKWSKLVRVKVLNSCWSTF